MPGPPRAKTALEGLASACAMSNLSAEFGYRVQAPRGVRKFRSIEEMDRHRQEWEAAAIREGRAVAGPPMKPGTPARGVEMRTQSLKTQAENVIGEKVFAAGVFEPNASYYGLAFGLFIVTMAADFRARLCGGLSSTTLWVVTETSLLIFKAKVRMLGAVRIGKLLGKWPLDMICVRSVTDRMPIEEDLSLAVGFTTPEGRRVEMRALARGPEELEVIGLLNNRLNPNGCSESDIGKPNKLWEWGFSQRVTALTRYLLYASFVAWAYYASGSSVLRTFALTMLYVNGIFSLVLLTLPISQSGWHKGCRFHIATMLVSAAIMLAGVLI